MVELSPQKKRQFGDRMEPADALICLDLAASRKRQVSGFGNAILELAGMR